MRRPVALCDAKVPGDGEDAFDWGVLVLRDFGGKGLASALLSRALHWLRDQGQTTADLTVTSGLDDYAPIVYVATVANRAQIRGRVPQLGQAPLRRLTRPSKTGNVNPSLTDRARQLDDELGIVLGSFCSGAWLQALRDALVEVQPIPA